MKHGVRMLAVLGKHLTGVILPPRVELNGVGSETRNLHWFSQTEFSHFVRDDKSTIPLSIRAKRDIFFWKQTCARLKLNDYAEFLQMYVS